GTFMSDMLGGHVDVAFENIAGAIPQVQQGNLRPLALSSNERLEQQLPNVPTVSELIPGFECHAWVGVLAAKGIPESSRKRLNEEINKIGVTPEFTAVAATFGASTAPMDLPTCSRFIEADVAKWQEVIPPLNIVLD